MARPRGSKKEREQAQRLVNGQGKLIGYIRASTKNQSDHGHSLAGQRARLEEVAEREGFALVDVIEEVESGAKERDGLAEAQERIMAGEAQGLVFPKVDRVGRSMIHLLRIVEWAEANRVDLLSADEGWQVRDGQKVDKMLPFRLAMAQGELERIRERTKDGLRAARAKGIRLGRPVETVEEIAARAAGLRRSGQTLQEIASLFNREGLRTARGKEFRPDGIFRMVNRVDPAANPVGGHQGKGLAAVA